MDALGLGLGSPLSGGGSSNILKFIGHCGEMGGINYTSAGGVKESQFRWYRRNTADGLAYNSMGESDYYWRSYPNNANWDVKYVAISITLDMQNEPYMCDTKFDQFVLYNAGEHSYSQSGAWIIFSYTPTWNNALLTKYPAMSAAFDIDFLINQYCLGASGLTKVTPALPARCFIHYNLGIFDYLFA